MKQAEGGRPGMNKSLKKNSLYYLFYNVLNMLFPFVSSLYVARVLLPESVGEVAYAQNVVSYFSILAFLGIPTYGIKAIAKARDSREEMDAVFSELFIINGISTVFFTAIYYALILIVPAFRASLALYATVGLTVVLNMLNISWLYEGLEEFGYVSLRNAIFKVIVFVLIVVFVKGERDVLAYAAITVFGVAGNNLINVIHARHFVRLRTTNLDLARHMKPIFMLVMVNLAIEIYTLVDTTMLGIMTTKAHVAYYQYASKVNKLLLQVTNSVTMALVPRIALCYKEKQFDAFNSILTKALKVIIIGAVPMIVGLQFTSEFLFSRLFGAPYIVSGPVERILCLVLLISPVGYLLGSRVMLVTDRESRMALCVCVGAIVNVTGNYFLIRTLCERGAAIASVVSEAVIMVMYVFQGRKVYRLNRYGDTVAKVCVAGALETALLAGLRAVLPESWLALGAQVAGAATVYVGTLILLKEPTARDTLFGLANRIFHRGGKA